MKRFDALRCDLSSAVIDPATGWLTVDGTAVVVGVLDYGTTKEFVPEQTLRASAGTLVTLPVTNGHPPDGMLTSANTRDYQVGTIIDARFDAEVQGIRVKLRITDSAAIDDIQTGKRELSLGYDATVERRDGIFNGKRFDGVQTARENNHISIVDAARSGRRARIDASMETVTISIDGVDYQVAPEVAAYFQKMQAPQQDAAPPIAQPPENQPKMDAATIAAITTNVTANLLKELRADGERRDSAARDLGDTVAACRPFLPQSYRTDGKDRGQILHDAIVARRPDLAAIAKQASGDVSRLQGMFDGLVVESTIVETARVDGVSKKDVDEPILAAAERQRMRLVGGGKK